MTVSELIEALQTLPQNAKVNVYTEYCPESGDYYNYVEKVEQETVGWDDANDKPIVEVYIL